MSVHEHIEVAVVGAGLAGLTAARELANRDVDFRLFEANPERVGGRVWSVEFDNGQTGERGAERIDSRHSNLIALITELGLDLEDHGQQSDDESATIIRVDGVTHGDHEIMAQRRSIADILLKEVETRGLSHTPGALADSTSPAAREFDLRSVREWIQTSVPGGASSAAGAALLRDVAHLTGLEPDQVSALALLDEWATLIGFVTGDMIDENNLADSRYRVRGGNGKIAAALREDLPVGSLRLDNRLVSLARDSDSTYRLEFANGDKVRADAVVLALPFPALRRVNLVDAEFSGLKREMIRTLELGSVAKLILQFNGRPQDLGNWNGSVFNDRPRFASWESTGEQEGNTCILTVFLAGASAADLPVHTAHGEAPRAVIDEVLHALDAAVPGLRERFTGSSWLDVWSDDEFVHGAYSVFRPGQYTRFFGRIGDKEKGVFFAGEHTSLMHRGFMNGAVETGASAAIDAAAYVSGRVRRPVRFTTR